MARQDISRAPYYDRYDSSKQYTHLLAVPGRVAQSRELTEIQSTVKDIVKGIGDSIFKDGNIIEGCQVSINKEEKIATISPGKVYLHGMVLPVAEKKLPIGAVGTETIGFVLDERIITEADDATLRDPAQGYANHNQPGCHRIKSEVSIVVNDPKASTLVTLIDGEVTVEKYAPEYDKMTTLLADRTYDESGSYIVRGLNTRVMSNEDDSLLTVLVEEGLAYIRGYRLNIPSPRRIPLSRSLDYTSITRSTTYQSAYYKLSEGNYVKEIKSVEGTRSHMISTMSAPTTNTSSQTITTPAEYKEFVDIVAVSQGDTTYESGVDYDIQGGGRGENLQIRWKGTSKYPTGAYSIIFTYMGTFTADKDYELTSNDGSHHLHWKDDGDKPVSKGTSLRISYDIYLARKDIVYIDQYGNITIKEGIPNQYGLEMLPQIPNTTDTLPLAHISHIPGGTHETAVVSNVALTRFTMSDVQNLLNRVRILEYNQSVTSLEDAGRQYSVSGAKKSIFTDPLIDFSKVDYYYNISNGVILDSDKPIYDVAIDFNSNICYLPIYSKSYDISYDESIESPTNKKYDRLVTLPVTGETVLLSQSNATRSFLINPYSTFPQLPEISLTPAVDNWIEDTIIEINVSQQSSEVIQTSTSHVERSEVRGGSFQNYTVESSSSVDTPIGTRASTSTNESVINQSALTYIRGREITVVGSNFPAGLGNISCYFDGVKINIYLKSDTEKTGGGMISADDEGKFEAVFTIPPHTFLSGIREVRLETSTPGYGSEGSAFALYQASGVSRTIQRTVTTLNTVLLNRVTTVTSTTYIDPVGQTFVLDRMSLVKGIDLYFEAKPTSDIPVTCDIREVVNGAITSRILAHKTLSANQVNISTDSNIATRFNFDDPVLLEENKEYAFVVRSTSANYRIWIADLGENDIISNQPVLSNPYLIGVMMSSSNNSSWTTHQTSDIKFRLLADNYDSGARNEIIFSKLTPTKTVEGEEEADRFSRVYLLADSIIPTGTSISWYYSTDDWATEDSISPYSIKLLNAMKDNISIKAVISKEIMNPNISPILALDTVGAVLSCYKSDEIETSEGSGEYGSKGTYISKEFTINDANNVDIILDTYTPDDSTKLDVYVITDNRDTKIKANFVSSESKNYNWEETVYRAGLSDTDSGSRCRIIIEMSSTNQYKTPAFSRLRAISYKE